MGTTGDETPTSWEAWTHTAGWAAADGDPDETHILRGLD